MAVAQKTHVPKFGNWDGDEVAYTKFFENARRCKGTGSKMFNPNDPEENPDAFASGIFPQETELTKQQNDDDYDDIHVVKYQYNQHQRKEDGRFQIYVGESSPRKSNYQRENMDPHRRSNRKSSNYDSNDDKNNADFSVLQSQYHPDDDSHAFSPSPYQRENLDPHRSSNCKSSNYDSNDDKSNADFSVLQSQYHPDDDSHAFSLSPYQRENLDHHRSSNRKSSNYDFNDDKSNADFSILQSENHPDDDSYAFSPSQPKAVPKIENSRQAEDPPIKNASVPKFGAWDGMGPKSGDGFTVIFSKVKEEKQITATTLRTVPAELTSYQHRMRGQKNTSVWSKICCCLFPSSRE